MAVFYGAAKSPNYLQKVKKKPSDRNFEPSDFRLGFPFKVHISWEGQKCLKNLHQLFDWQYIGQIIGGDISKFCGLLRIYKL